MNEIKTLSPIKNLPSDFDELEEIIRKLFRDEIYLPLVKELKAKHVIQNEIPKALIDAIRTDKITFDRGSFSGKFSAAISKDLRKIGAKFDVRTSTFKLPMYKLPDDLRQEIQASVHRFNKVTASIDRQLQKILPEEIADKLETEKFFDKTLWQTNNKIKEQLKAIKVTPTLTKDATTLIAKEYTKNLQKYIVEFTTKETTELRNKIKEKILSGGRYESMVDVIQESYNVSTNKAKFLARQETGLLMAKFQEARYKDAGINDYIWKCVVGSPLHPVRPMHKALDGTKHSWDNPPVTDAKGNRNNPGEDYNCRCFARPIVSFK